MDTIKKEIADILQIRTQLSEYGLLKDMDGELCMENEYEVRLLNKDQYVDHQGIIRDRKGVDIRELYDYSGYYGMPILISYLTGKADFEFTSTHMVCNYKWEKYMFPLGDMKKYTEKEDLSVLELLKKINKNG